MIEQSTLDRAEPSVSKHPGSKTQKTATKPGESKDISLAEYEELLSNTLKPRGDIPEHEADWVRKTLFEKLS